MQRAMEKAIREAGGIAALAEALGVSRTAIYQWREQGKVSYKRVLRVEELTGVSRHELRPDIYPR